MSRFIPQIALVLLILIAIFRVGVAYLTDKKISGQVTVVGWVDSQPKISGQAQIFKIGRLDIIASRYPEINFGDKVKIEGKIENNKIAFGKVDILQNNDKLGFFVIISKSRKNFIDKINSYLPEPQASLLSGMVLGNDQIERSFKSDLKTTGTLHVVVVSGQNITLVAGFFMALAGLIKRQFAIVITFVGIIFYTMLAGFEPPVVRAAIMGAIGYFGVFVGRATLGFYSLIIAGCVMLIFQPQIVFNLSFILSFAATFGIIWLGPKIKSKIIKLAFFNQEIATTVSAYLLTLPVLVYNFGQISLISILANILVSFVIIPIMILGFVTIFTGIVITQVGQLLAWIVYLPLSYFSIVVSTLAQLPFASISLDKISFYLIIVYYLAIFSIFEWRYLKKPISS